MPEDGTPQGRSYLVKNLDGVVTQSGGEQAPRWRRVQQLIKIVEGNGHITFSSENATAQPKKTAREG
jgi:hypothetical protein